jgi:hypothetical protein
MKVWVVGLLLCLSAVLPVVAQDKATLSERSAEPELVYDIYPRVFLVSTLNLNGGGFSVLSQSGNGGISLERPLYMLEGSFGYDNARKVNDNTTANIKGHSRTFGGSAMYRMRNGWFFGGGAAWGELSTTNYTKQHWAPSFGGGKDVLMQNFSFRLKCMYTLPGSDRINGTQGPTVTFITPSPATRHHVFFYEALSLSLFHDTVTDPSNRQLTEIQRSNRSLASYLRLWVMVRF